jgi:hypothetical protein
MTESKGAAEARHSARDATTTPSAGLLARAALALYPPAWRARYGEEVRGLLEDSGGGLRAAAGVACRAVPAWIWPPQHLFDRPARMRASLATAGVAWSVLTGLGLVFAQLSEFQGDRPSGHPVVGWSYAVFNAAVAVSVLAVAAAGLPLWLLMLRRARREHRVRDAAYLLLPVAAPAAYLAALAITVPRIRGADGVSPPWFLGVILAGFAAAAVAAAGPGLALRRMGPRGPALRLAAAGAGLAVTAMVIAAAASTIAATGLYSWARDFAGYHNGGALGVYLALVVTSATVAAVSAARGARAALARRTADREQNRLSGH